VEAMMIASGQPSAIRTIEKHLNNLLGDLSKSPEENHYLISWILYFMKSNRLQIKKSIPSANPILRSIRLNRCTMFSKVKNFELFRPVHEAKRAGSLLKHLDVFKPQ
jgi:hypothetical protein